MQSLQTKNFTSSYLELLNLVKTEGQTVKPRGKETKELSPFLLTIENPAERVTMIGGRDINTFFLVVEALWILGARDDVKTLSKFNSNIKNFSDDGLTFHAPYGQRLRHYGMSIEHLTEAKMSVYEKFENYTVMKSMHTSNIKFDIDQLKTITELFKNDIDTRQAVASIWSSFYDLASYNFTKDVPCNDLLMFKVRNGCLNLTVCNRSNDIHWGLPTNIFQFSFVLEAMSLAIGVKTGRQSHAIDSLHFYLEDPTKPGTTQKINENLLLHEKKNFPLNFYDYVSPTKMSLNEDFIQKESNNKASLYEIIFENVIETSLYAIDCFDDFENFIVSGFDKIIDDSEGMRNINIYEICFENFQRNKNSYYSFRILKEKSEYFHSLVMISLSYAIYKRMRSENNTITEKQFVLNNALFYVSIKNLFGERDEDILNKDIRVSCLNFLYTRYYNRTKKAKDDFESYGYEEMLQIFENELNIFDIPEVLKNFIKEAK